MSIVYDVDVVVEVGGVQVYGTQTPALAFTR